MDYEQLKIDLEQIAGEREMKYGETLAKVLVRLDNSAHLDDTPIQLKHYLLQRSYIKALDWINDSSTPHQE